jgi:Ca-activated chloride channel family protein
MSRRRRDVPARGAAPVAAIAALAAAAVGLAAPPAAALDVLVRSPRPGAAAFGEVAIEVEVLSAEPVEAVVFRVDGRQVGRLTAPPWRLVVDVGSDNVEHQFEIVARDAAGEEATARVGTPKIRVDEELDLQLQQLYVTVSRPTSAEPLDRDAFRIQDDGDAQQIVTFERGDAPLTAALLVDTSSSMHGDRLQTAIRGAMSFLAGLRELDEATLTLFSDRRIHGSGFSRVAYDLVRGVEKVAAAGGTALNDHLYFALRLLEGRQGRRVVVVLSDGVDTDSVLTADDVLWAAKRSQAMIYWIRLRSRNEPGTFSTSWRSRKEHAQELATLERTVAESGGKAVPIDDVAGAELAFWNILVELRSQYVLGYYPSRNRDDGRWHQVAVSVPGRSAQVRTRSGYIDY